MALQTDRWDGEPDDVSGQQHVEQQSHRARRQGHEQQRERGVQVGSVVESNMFDNVMVRSNNR